MAKAKCAFDFGQCLAQGRLRQVERLACCPKAARGLQDLQHAQMAKAQFGHQMVGFDQSVPLQT